MAKEEWIVAGVILGGLVLVGVLAWAFKKRGSSRGELQLRRVTEPKVVLKNLEITKIVRDQEGNIVALEVHREVKRSE